MFWNKPKQQENVSEALISRVSKVETRLNRLEAEILDIATAQEIIRNKVLRKIQFKKEPETETQDLNSKVILTDDGKPYR